MLNPALKLGRKAKLILPNMLPMARFLDKSKLPVMPDQQVWSAALKKLGMMLNDKIGDCTCAGMGHGFQVWTANHGKQITIPNSIIEKLYEAVAGYNPQTGANDNGAALATVVDYVMKHGLAGHKIDAAVDVDVKDIKMVMEAMYLFGGAYTGFNVPSDIDQTPGAVWRYNGCKDIEGGHCVYFVDYSESKQMFKCISWGAFYYVTVEFFQAYFDEVIGLLSADWASKMMAAPNRFNYAQLLADQRALGRGLV